MTNLDPFQYTYRAFDMMDVSNETKEIMDSRDIRIEGYINNLLNQYDFRWGTVVFNLPAVGAGVNFLYQNVPDISPTREPFDSNISWGYIMHFVTNGDVAANPANLGIQAAGLTGVTIAHINNGNVGGLCRANFLAIGHRARV